MLTCPRCGYEWTPRKASPKSCPMCRRYLPTTDYAAHQEAARLKRQEELDAARKGTRDFEDRRLEAHAMFDAARGRIEALRLSDLPAVRTHMELGDRADRALFALDLNEIYVPRVRTPAWDAAVAAWDAERDARLAAFAAELEEIARLAGAARRGDPV